MMSQENLAAPYLPIESDLFKTADKLRGNLEPSEYKHIALGLIFLRYISKAFEAKRETLQTQDYADPDDRDEYTAANVFWVPEIARWSNLKAYARTRDIEFIDPIINAPKKVDIGGLIDAAIEAIELENAATLRGVLAKDYGRP